MMNNGNMKSYNDSARYYNGGSNRPSSRTDAYSRQASGRSINFNDHHGDSVEGSVMMDQNGQILVRENTANNHYRSHQQQQQQQQLQPPPPLMPMPPPTSVNNNGGGADSAYNDEEDREDTKSQQIQVQILPQDDNWGENTTAFTADFSDFNDDMTEDGRSSHYNPKSGAPDNCSYNNNKDEFFSKSATKNCTKKLYGLLNLYLTKYFGFICALCVSVSAFITPILFVTLPRLNLDQQWQLTECGLECEGQLIGMAFKLFILLIGAWAIFARRPKAILPRIYELRALLLFILCLMTFSFWLFYGVRIIDAHTQDYYKILQFTDSYVDVLLFVFIVSVFILELRHIQPQYVVKIIRSPDGEQRQYTIGKMSIQRAAIWLLEQYYKDFGVYNPWIESAHRKRLNTMANQHMQIEHDGGNGKKGDKMSSRSKMSSSRMNAGAGTVATANFNANERFYEEYDYERRLKKRKMRLITSTEEAFTHIRRMQFDAESMNTSNHTGNNSNNGSPTLMDPYEAAQAIFTSIARDLRRYLRVTRQQPYFTRDSIIAHLANCISYDMSPKSFLQRYLVPEPLVFNERALVSASSEQQAKLSAVLPHSAQGVNYHLNLKTLDQSWILICDTVLYQNCEDNLMFVLKQNEVSLMCTFKRLPYFNLIEDILDPKRNKFVLKLNSETTV